MQCGFRSGFFLSKPCAREAAEQCARCAKPFCLVHGKVGDEALCRRCLLGDMLPFDERPVRGVGVDEVIGGDVLFDADFSADDYAAMERMSDDPDDAGAKRAGRFES